MSYQLRFDRSFMRQIESLPGDLRSVARRLVGSLADRPRPAQAKELDGHPTYFRLWLPRTHRLVYQILDDEQVVDLLYIGPKPPDLYEQLGLGRRSE